jgi:hypothetical protein
VVSDADACQRHSAGNAPSNPTKLVLCSRQALACCIHKSSLHSMVSLCYTCCAHSHSTHLLPLEHQNFAHSSPLCSTSLTQLHRLSTLVIQPLPGHEMSHALPQGHNHPTATGSTRPTFAANLSLPRQLAKWQWTHSLQVAHSLTAKCVLLTCLHPAMQQSTGLSPHKPQGQRGIGCTPSLNTPPT